VSTSHHHSAQPTALVHSFEVYCYTSAWRALSRSLPICNQLLF